MTMFDRFLPAAKAWAAFLGAVLTALVGTLTPDDAGYRVLTMLLAVVTAVAVYRVRNKRNVTVRLRADTSQIDAELRRARDEVDALEQRLRRADPEE